MRWLFDTNLFIETAAGKPHASSAMLLAAEIEWAGYSAISRVEALGFPRLTPEAETHLRRLFDQFIEVSVTTEVIEKAISLRREVRMKTPDAIIAASALVNGAELVTRNIDDFKRVAGLVTVDPSVL